MTLIDRITQARHDRTARAAARAELQKLAAELASYSTSTDRAEIELIAARTPGPDSDRVLDILNQVWIRDTRPSLGFHSTVVRSA